MSHVNLEKEIRVTVEREEMVWAVNTHHSQTKALLGPPNSEQCSIVMVFNVVVLIIVLLGR